MWLTSQDTIRFELSKNEARKYQEFRDKVKGIKTEELAARKDTDFDEDYLMKRSKSTDYDVTVNIVNGSIGFSVYVSCDALGLKEDITDHDTW